MSSLRDSALAYAARGWRVFPLHGIADGACTCGRVGCSSPGKHPRVRRGLHEATTDPAEIDKWWTRWPDANIGVVTGPVSGFVVIDLDEPDSAVSVARLELLGHHLSPTLTAMTGVGRHLYYATELVLTNTTRRLPGIDEDLAGIDLRADGGYVVAPPSTHVSGTTYEWSDPAANLTPLPTWIRPRKRPSPTTPMARAPAADGDGTVYGLAALQAELETLTTTPEGSRNHQLNRAAFALGQLIAGGELEERRARSELLSAALAIGLPEREARQTLDSAFTAGAREPRSAPNRASHGR